MKAVLNLSIWPFTGLSRSVEAFYVSVWILRFVLVLKLFSLWQSLDRDHMLLPWDEPVIREVHAARLSHSRRGQPSNHTVYGVDTGNPGW